MGKPVEVQRARLAGNLPLLSAMGRKGGRKKHANRNSRKKRRMAIMEMGMREMRYQALEHISDPNRESVEYSKVITSA